MKPPILAKRAVENPDEDVLRYAVKLACDELIEVHQFNGATNSSLVDTIAYAILEKFNEGERTPSLLAEHAMAKVLNTFKFRLH